ncbi:MAG: hypothetical protein AAFO51_08230, partial [Pseudomonadota bacterium]
IDVQQAIGVLINTNAGFEYYDGALVAEVFAKNFLNEEYIIDGGNTGGVFQIPTYIAGQPRHYGVRVKARF